MDLGGISLNFTPVERSNVHVLVASIIRFIDFLRCRLDDSFAGRVRGQTFRRYSLGTRNPGKRGRFEDRQNLVSGRSIW